MQYDVIVIGAGTAESTTARECATRGLMASLHNPYLPIGSFVATAARILRTLI